MSSHLLQLKSIESNLTVSEGLPTDSCKLRLGLVAMMAFLGCSDLDKGLPGLPFLGKFCQKFGHLLKILKNDCLICPHPASDFSTCTPSPGAVCARLKCKAFPLKSLVLLFSCLIG